MSRSAASAVHEHDRPRLRPRPYGAPATRRVSGPAYPTGPRTAASAAVAAVAPAPRTYPRAPHAPHRPLRLVAGGLALRVADKAVEVSGSRAMDRLVRSRAWIVIVGFGLIGIVAMQVSLLKLNSGIGRAVDTVATLERSNATLKADISRLSSGDRIQALAGQRGFAMPAPADVTYLTAGDLRSDGFQAARKMTAPNPAITGPAGAAAAANLSDSLATDTAAAPGAGTAAATTATPPATTTSATAGAPPAATQTQAQTPPAAAVNGAAAATTATPSAVAPQTTSSGGVTLP